MIRFGPAGIPLSCKGRTLRDGIADIHHLGLTAMEIQFIKVNPLSRLAMDEEVAKTPRELLQQLVVTVGNNGAAGTQPTLSMLTSPLKRRDNVTTIATSLAKDYTDLQQTKALARALDVDLTLHAPYYVDFFGSDEARERSQRQIQWASVLAEGLGARMVMTHLGFYGAVGHDQSIEAITQIVQDLSTWLAQYSKGTVRLGIEPSGHPDVFGSQEEVLELVRRVKGTVPILNLPHLAARQGKTFDKPEDLDPVLQEFRRASAGSLYLNFSGVEIWRPGEFRLTPIKRGTVRFDPLAELLAERDYDATVISSSPLLEHDAMYMKVLYERALTRRWMKRHGPPPSLTPTAPKPKAAVPARKKTSPPRPRASPARSSSSPKPHPRPRTVSPPLARNKRREDRRHAARRR